MITSSASEGLRHVLFNVFGASYLLGQYAGLSFIVLLLTIPYWCWAAVQNHLFQSVICFHLTVLLLLLEMFYLAPHRLLRPFLDHELRLSPIEELEGFLRAGPVMLFDDSIVTSWRVVQRAHILLRSQGNS